jgi:hypothetical protein
MNTSAGWLQPMLKQGALAGRAEPQAGQVEERVLWDLEEFAEEQIRCLVRQVFFPGWPEPARQVVFTAVDRSTDISAICMQVAGALEMQTQGTVCVVEADRKVPGLVNGFVGTPSDPISVQEKSDPLRKSSRQISRRLWVVPLETFPGEIETGLSADWLQGRLDQLRLDFDYTLVHAPAAGVSSEAALLGHLSDGVILVLEASSTRRLAAQRVQTMLQAADARLLGIVLSERTFPIPQRIYRRL